MNPQNNTSTFTSNLTPESYSSGNKSSGRKKKLIVVIVVLVIIVILAGVTITLLGSKNTKTTTAIGNNGKIITITNTPTSVQSQFMSAIINSNNKGAYDLTSQSFKAKTNQSSFNTYVKYLNVNKLSISAVKVTTKNNKTIVAGEIISNGVHIFNFESRMVEDNSHWKVDNFIVNP
jgi:hypothetical protein